MPVARRYSPLVQLQTHPDVVVLVFALVLPVAWMNCLPMLKDGVFTWIALRER